MLETISPRLLGKEPIPAAIESRPSVVSRIRFDNGMLQGPPHPRAPRSPRPPRGGGILLPSPLWGRGWRASGVIASRGGPGEGVSPIVNSYVGHHTSVVRHPSRCI
jgi:hypothetical protein